MIRCKEIHLHVKQLSVSSSVAKAMKATEVDAVKYLQEIDHINNNVFTAYNLQFTKPQLLKASLEGYKEMDCGKFLDDMYQFIEDLDKGRKEKEFDMHGEKHLSMGFAKSVREMIEQSNFRKWWHHMLKAESRSLNLRQILCSTRG